MISTTRCVAAAAVLGLLFPARARAAEPNERVQTLVLGAALNRLVTKQLPVVVDVAAFVPADRDAGLATTRLTVTEARYCGGVDGGRGRALAVVSTDAAAPASQLLSGDHDCDDKLVELARRLAPGAGGAAAVAEVTATWAPWALQLKLGEVAAVGDGAAALGRSLARARVAGPVMTFETAGLRVTIARGSSLSLDLALEFPRRSDRGDAVSLTLTPAGQERARGGAGPSSTGAPAGVDGIVAATLPFINRVLALLNHDGPMLLHVDSETVEIRDVQVAGSEGAVVVRGRATLRSTGDSVHIALESTGADLKISQVRAEAELEDCGAGSAFSGLACRARNVARAAAASAAAAALTGRYRGQLLRVLAEPSPFSFDLGDRTVTLRLTPLRVGASSAGLVVPARLDLE